MRRRPKKNRSKQCIPLDLWFEILSYLPVKSLLRFRPVSKSWKSIIGDPNFSSIQFKRGTNNIQNPYFIFWESVRLSRWVLRCSKTFLQASDIEFPLSSTRRWDICNGVDGLILFSGIGLFIELEDTIVVWNPSIRKAIYLPPPPNLGVAIEILLCLLVDAANDDYKVVMISYSKNRESVSTHIYSLKSRSWGMVVESNNAPVRMVLLLDSNACIGGSAHWISSDRKVVSFDLGTDMFSYTQSPGDANNRITKFMKLIVLSGAILGYFVLFPDDSVTIWVMEKSSCDPSTFDESKIQQYGWTKRYRMEAVFRRETFCVSVQKRDVLLWSSKGSLCSFDIETNKLKFPHRNYTWLPSCIFPYVESLLLLEHTSGIASQQGLDQISHSSQSSGYD